MAREVCLSKDTRTAMLNGVNVSTDVVRVTLEPKGRNIVLGKRYGSPLITDDGVSTTEKIRLEDKFENMDAKLVYEIASETNDTADDGTTAATILAQSVVSSGFRQVEKGVNPVLMREGVGYANKETAKYILEKPRKMETGGDIINIATVSGGSKEVGKITAEFMEKIGRNGVVSIDESSGSDTEPEISEGMQYDKGYVSPYMVNDYKKVQAELENTYVLITDQRVNSVQKILSVLEQAVQANRPLLLIADDVENEVTSTLVVNELRGASSIVATKASGFGDNWREILKDTATLTGANFYSKDLSMDLREMELGDLGTVREVVVTGDSMTMINGNGSKDAIDTRVKETDAQMEDCKSDYDKKRYVECLGKLNGGIIIAKVGAITENELKGKRLHIRDILSAARATIAESTAIGDGTALVEAYITLKDGLKSDVADVQKGIRVVTDALLTPITQIAENAGYNAEEIVEQQKTAKENIDSDAKNGNRMDMFRGDIIDPAKVIGSALLNSTGISTLFLATEAGIATIKGKEVPVSPVPAGPTY